MSEAPENCISCPLGHDIAVRCDEKKITDIDEGFTTHIPGPGCPFLRLDATNADIRLRTEIAEYQSVRYQSAVSGLWYSNPGAAGSISAIRKGNQTFPVSDAAKDAEIERLRAEVIAAMDIANGRWCEWGERAMMVEDALRQAIGGES